MMFLLLLFLWLPILPLFILTVAKTGYKKRTVNPFLALIGRFPTGFL